MTKLKYLIIVIVLIITTGCDNYHELNELGIVTALGIDKVDDDYIVTAQLVNTQKADSTNIEFSSFITLEGTGKSIKDAFDKINEDSSKFLYLSHLNLLLISEGIAKENFYSVLDVFIREPVSRTDFLVLLAKDNKANEILKTFTNINSIPSVKIVNTIKEDFSANSNTLNLEFLDVLKGIAKYNYNLTIPSVTIEGNIEEGLKEDNLKQNKDQAKLIVSQVGVIKDNKLVDYLNKDEVMYYNILNNNFKESSISYKCSDGNNMTIKIESSTADTKSKLVNKELINEISLEGKIYIYENNCTIKDNIDNIVKEDINNIILENSNNLINKTKLLNTDIFGFLNNIYLNEYKKTNQIDDNTYKNSTTIIKTTYELLKKGNEQTNIIGDLDEN